MSDLAPNPGEVLGDLSRYYKLDGDWLVCLACKRPQQVRWCHAAFPHKRDCKSEKAGAAGHPWLVLGDAIQCARSMLPLSST